MKENKLYDIIDLTRVVLGSSMVSSIIITSTTTITL